MIPPSQHQCVQIVITNICPMSCCHCSQMCPHVPKDREYFMSLDQVEEALKSLEGKPGNVGMFGGEPTLHPQFGEICELYRKYIPVKARRELWTNGLKWKTYKDIIEDTFYKELVAYNEHEKEQPCWHQPNNIGLEEIRDGLFEKFSLRENCWVQQRWSSAITPMGAYFCEVASAREYILNRWKGLKVEPGWWKRPLSDFNYQMQSCDDCSMCIPIPDKYGDSQICDVLSKKNMDAFRKVGSPKVLSNEAIVIDRETIREFIRGHQFIPQDDYQKRGGFKDFPDWEPWKYRRIEDKKHEPRKTNE